MNRGFVACVHQQNKLVPSRNEHTCSSCPSLAGNCCNACQIGGQSADCMPGPATPHTSDELHGAAKYMYGIRTKEGLYRQAHKLVPLPGARCAPTTRGDHTPWMHGKRRPAAQGRVRVAATGCNVLALPSPCSLQIAEDAGMPWAIAQPGPRAINATCVASFK